MTFNEAYYKALEEGPGDATRKTACQYPWCAYNYARNVDQCARDDTRAGASKDPWCAYWYAQDVDRWLHPRAVSTLGMILQAIIEEELEFD